MSYKNKRSRKPLGLETAQLRMTDAINRLEEIIAESADSNKVVNATNALSGVIARYTKLYEVANLEKRISKLEQINGVKK